MTEQRHRQDCFPEHDTLVVKWGGNTETADLTSDQLEKMDEVEVAWYRPAQRSIFLLLKRDTSEKVRDKIAELGLEVDDTF